MTDIDWDDLCKAVEDSKNIADDAKEVLCEALRTGQRYKNALINIRDNSKHGSAARFISARTLGAR